MMERGCRSEGFWTVHALDEGPEKSRWGQHLEEVWAGITSLPKVDELIRGWFNFLNVDGGGFPKERAAFHGIVKPWKGVKSNSERDAVPAGLASNFLGKKRNCSVGE